MANPVVTLALLPLENLSDSAELGCLAKGFVQDLITELARFPSLGVIAADSVFAAGADGKEGAELARQLGADFFLKGSIRRSGEFLRISIQLLEAESGRHFWAGRYDEDQLPALQDEITAKVANALAIRVDQTLLSTARRRPPPTLKAYECWLRGMECLQRGTTDADVEGRQFFECALESDPHYARAFAGISLSHFNEWSCQAWDKWEEKERLAYEYAVKAEALDPDDAAVQVILGRIEQYRREFDRVAPRLDRARALAPNDANILIQLASCYTFQGNAELGWNLARHALELNPLCPDWFYCYAALPLFSLHRYQEALEVASKSPPGLVVDAPAYKAAACAYLGQTAEAARFLSEFRADFTRRITCRREPAPDELFRWTLHVNPYRRNEDADHLAEGLRRAGLEGPVLEAGKLEPISWPIANAFRHEGAWWTLSFEHQVIQMADMRGLQDLARLLSCPNEEVSSAELANVAVHSAGLDQLDTRALEDYRGRLREIDEEIEEASQAGASGRVGKLEEERDAIICELQRATGLGGRIRQSGGAGERARTAVTWRIRHAIRKIEAAHPTLGRHLSRSIRTGAFCSYEPERPTSWHL